MATRKHGQRPGAHVATKDRNDLSARLKTIVTETSTSASSAMAKSFQTADGRMALRKLAETRSR